MKVLVNNYLAEKEEKVEVKDLQEARSVIKKIIDENCLGASDWYLSGKTGNVYEGEKVIAHISYNGRVWEVDTDGKQINKEIIL
jgi:hypothetical protein